MEVAYEIMIDGLKKYGAEIIGGSLAYVTFWLWRKYQKKIISGLKFLLLFVLAVIAAGGLYAVLSVLGKKFMQGVGVALLMCAVIWAVDRARARKSGKSVPMGGVVLAFFVAFGLCIVSLLTGGEFLQGVGFTLYICAQSWFASRAF